MIRKFQILDSYRKDQYLGDLLYDTDTKLFRVLVLDDYTGKSPDPFMAKYSGQGELPPDMVDRWIHRRLMPPNRHAISFLLKELGIDEYDEMKLFDVTHGKAAVDSLYFKEIT